MKSISRSFCSFVRGSIPTLVVCGQLAACIVNQPLGGREDGASTPSDSASPTDAMPSSADAAPMAEDSSVVEMDVRVAPTPDASRDAGVVPTDAAAIHVQEIEISVITTRPIPALGGGSTSVQLLFRDRPRTDVPTTVIEHSGDCDFKESRPVPNSPPPTLDGVTIRVSAPGAPTVVARRDTLGTSDYVVGRYNASFASVLAAGTVVHIEVDAFGSVPAFSRDVTATEVRYVAPTPVTDNAMARYLTRSAGQPMPVAFELAGAAPTHALFDVIMMSAEGVVRELRCDFSAGRTSTTIASSLLDRAAPYANTAVGGASVLLMAVHNPPSTTLPNGTTVSIAGASTLVAGLRI